METVHDELSQHTVTGQMPATVGKLSPSEFMKYVEEVRQQPAFRASQDKAADYYDGNQLTPEILEQLDKMGFSQLMTNLIKPAIDAVLGIEAKTRTDLRVTADDDAHAERAEAFSAKLAEAERQSRADRACSDAYASQVKTGLGWVHVGRNQDPFQYPYKVEAVHRREMYWDWSAPVSDTGLDQARYVIRQKWFPVDQISASMPQHAQLVNATSSGWTAQWLTQAMEDTALRNALDQEHRISVTAWDWRNIDARRAALQECWYATYIRGLVLDLGDRVVEFDRNNPLHMAAVGSGQFRPQPAVYRKLRCSLWLGPHLLQDYDPGGNKMPYVPFWGFREDLTGVPYGLIRSMMPLQDEVNARRRKLMWLLSSKRVQIDSDALDAQFMDLSDLTNEVSRPDSVLVLNPKRQNANSVKIESDLGLSQQQFEVLTEAKQGIQDAAGIFNSVMGKSDGAHSGIAINSLIEQSSNTLGEINDNFKFSRQQVGERLLNLIRQDLSGRPVQVIAGPNEARRKIISLNKPAVDPITGVKYFENDVDKAMVKVALEDVPSTPAYRAQQLMMLGETIKALPPAAQGALIPYYIEGTDLPQRHKMADLVRKAMGLPTDDDQQDPQVAALQQQIQQLHQQSQQMAQQYEQAVAEKSQEAQDLQQKLAGLQVDLKNKQGDLALRQRELDMRTAESQATAQRELMQMALKRQELTLKAASDSANHAHRQAELEHKQISDARSHHLARTEAEQQVTPQEQLDHERAVVGIKVAGAVTQAIEVAKIKAESAVEVAELRATGAPSTLTPEQAKAADDAVADNGSDRLEAAPESSSKGGTYQQTEGD